MPSVRRFRLTPFFSDLFWTLLTQGFVLIAGLLLFRLAAEAFGPDGFGEYQLSRRIAALTTPLILLGLGVGLPRYLGMSHGGEPVISASYAAVSGLCIGSVSILLVLALNAFPSAFSRLLFGGAGYRSFTFPLSLLVFGLAACAFVYSYYRGSLRMKVANLLQSIGIGALPVALIVVIPGCTVRLLVGLTGIGLSATAAVFAAPIIRKILMYWRSLRIRTSVRELLRYGLPRVPGDFAIVTLLGLGPVLAAHFAAIREVGYLATAQALLSLLSVSVAPLGIVLLPRISHLLAQGREEEIRKNLSYLVSAAFHISIFVVIQIMVFLDVIVGYWLGREFVEGALVMRVVTLPLPFLLSYVAMRSPIDAARIKAINTRNLGISVGVYAVVAAASLACRQIISPVLGLGVALVAGITVLGILTCVSTKRIYHIDFKLGFVMLAICLSLILGSAGWFLKPYLKSGAMGIVQLAGIEFFLLAVYMLLLVKCGVRWPREVLSKMTQRFQE